MKNKFLVAQKYRTSSVYSLQSFSRELSNSTEGGKSEYSCNSMWLLVQYEDISTKLKSELDQDKQSLKALGHVLTKVDSLSNELKLKRKQIEDLEKEKIKLIIKHKEQLSINEKELEEAKSENIKLKEDLEQIKKDIKFVKDNNKIELEKYKKLYEDSIELNNNQKKKLESDKESLIKDNQLLQDKIKTMTTNIEKLNKNKLVNCLKFQKAYIDVKIQTMNAEEDLDLEKKIKREISLLNNKCNDLQTTNEKLRKEIFKLHHYQSLFEVEREKVNEFVNIRIPNWSKN